MNDRLQEIIDNPSVQNIPDLNDNLVDVHRELEESSLILMSNERVLSNWVYNILDFTSIIQGNFSKEIVKFDIFESLEEVMLSQTHIAEKLGVHININID